MKPFLNVCSFVLCSVILLYKFKTLCVSNVGVNTRNLADSLFQFMIANAYVASIFAPTPIAKYQIPKM